MVGEQGAIQISEYRLQDLDTQRCMTRRLNKLVSVSAKRQATANRFSSDKTSTAISERYLLLMPVGARRGRLTISQMAQGLGCRATCRVRAAHCVEASACVRYKKTLRWRVFIINNR